MMRAHRVLIAYAAFVLLWAVPTLYSSIVRASHRELLLAIYTHNDIPEEDPLNSALGHLRGTLALAPCHMALHHDHLIMLAAAAEESQAQGDLDAIDHSLADTQRALGAQLSCSPLDGKSWFDYAMLTFEREGFSSRVRKAFAMSERVSPRESWLAEKRVRAAMPLAPMLDKDTRAIVLKDLTTLDAANHYRLNALQKEAGVTSLTKLRALFAPNASETERTP